MILHPNYPNPFNSSTSISYSLPTGGAINLTVFDLQGREIGTLYRGYRQPGSYRLNFDGRSLSSGTYLIQLAQGISIQTRKLRC